MKLYSILFEDFRRGDSFEDFLRANPEKKQEILLKLGATEEQLPELLDFLEENKDDELGQIFAVLADEKPMWYGSPSSLFPSTTFGKLLSNNLKKLGLSIVIVKDFAVLGRPENVASAGVELNRINGDYSKIDSQFHRTIGLALGYPKEDVEAFIEAKEKELAPEYD